MDAFYEKRRKAYYQKYFGKRVEQSIYWTNGFQKLPKSIYRLFLSYINGDGNIIDLGCGNGLLLNYLKQQAKYDLIPFGLDFQKASINQARKKILPEFAQNFFVQNIAELDFPPSFFQFIIFEPYHLADSDRPKVLKKLMDMLKKGGRLIIYSYYDSMSKQGYVSLSNYPGLEKMRLRKLKIKPGYIFIGYWQKP